MNIERIRVSACCNERRHGSCHGMSDVVVFSTSANATPSTINGQVVPSDEASVVRC